MNITPGYTDPDTYFFFRYRTDGQNLNNMDDPEINQALDAGRTEMDQAKRKDAYSRAQMLWVDSLPGPIFAHRSTAHAATPGIKGFTPHPAFQQDFAGVSREK